jgi:hypothetical protein
MSTFLLALVALSASASGKVDYLRDIKPILAERCYSCHGALQQKGGLRLDTVAQMREAGVLEGDSELLKRVIGGPKVKRMPPPEEGEALEKEHIEHLKQWIKDGAKGPPEEKPEPDPKDHWAFRPIVRPSVPALGVATTNPIDAFLDAAMRKQGITPQGQAQKRLLLRRVTIDLIGLPPTQAEMDAFEADTRSDAYERVVERLLASKMHGERWGRHWLDIWRYSDWWGLGAEVRNSQKHIHHWRDWVIESVNADLGYDEMIRQMLAADELYPSDEKKLRATGFLVRQYFKFNRNTWLEETVEHTSKAFLGLTTNCAKCHDHKYDPISQKDFFRLRAFFEPYQIRTDMIAGESDFEKNGIPRAFDCNHDAPTYLFVRGDERNPIKSKGYAPGLPPLLFSGDLRITPVALPLEAHSPGLRDSVLATLIDQAEQSPTAPTQIAAIKARAAADRVRNDPTKFKILAREAVLAERRAALAVAELALHMGDAKAQATAKANVEKLQKSLDAPGENYTPIRGSLKTLESNLESEASRNKPFPTTSTGRRSALANWLTSESNPLTARVAVNHIWLRHFGTPLVPTIFDFGRKGKPPIHPELLDYLASELRQNNWSTKHLHRLLVTSAAYKRSASSVDAAAVNLSKDKDNQFYWRRNSVRMEAEVVRDSLLYLAGDLDLTTGGPSVALNQDTRRRSMYIVHSHNDKQKFLETFDDANVLECYRRSESIVPQQALALSNSLLSMTTAEAIARRIGTKSEREFVRTAFETVLGQSPTSEEAKEMELALSELLELAKSERRSDGPARARATILRALLNHNDFVTVR